jgi:hypothetical protein
MEEGTTPETVCDQVPVPSCNPGRVKFLCALPKRESPDPEEEAAEEELVNGSTDVSGGI